MKILFILESFHPNIGGVETLFRDLSLALAKQDFEITVLTTQSSHNNNLSKELSGVKIVRLPFRNRYLFTFLAWIPATYYAFKNDLIQTTSYNAGIPAIVASVLAWKKVIITFHEVWGKMWFRLPYFSKFSLSLHYLFEKMLLLLPFTKFVAVSEFTKKQLIAHGINEKKVTRIYNGLDYSFLKPRTIVPKNERFTFLYFGRLGISKGLDILIKGASKVEEKFKLEIVVPRQPTNFLNTIKQEIKEANLESKVSIFHELPSDEMKNKIESADTVIIPSYSEGFGFCAVETIALGVPIISSDQGSLREVVNGKYIKMESFDGIGLANAMRKALNGEYENSPQIKYHLTDSIKAYIDLYSEYGKSKA